MGKTLVSEVLSSSKLKLVGATEHSRHSASGQDVGLLSGTQKLNVPLVSSLTEISSAGQTVVVDFTSPEASLENVKLAIQKKWAMVIGTTGFDQEGEVAIGNASKKIPIVKASNMSVGINVMLQLVTEAATLLGDSFDIEILEAHHKLKKDAPSGTAVSLARVLAEATGKKYPNDFNFGRKGLIGERPQGEIGMQVIRGGDIVGDHTVIYCGIGERVEIKHIATSRATFAKGALRAAGWLQKQKPGLYDMRDVLGM